MLYCDSVSCDLQLPFDLCPRMIFCYFIIYLCFIIRNVRRVSGFAFDVYILLSLKRFCLLYLCPVFSKPGFTNKFKPFSCYYAGKSLVLFQLNFVGMFSRKTHFLFIIAWELILRTIVLTCQSLLERPFTLIIFLFKGKLRYPSDCLAKANTS